MIASAITSGVTSLTFPSLAYVVCDAVDEDSVIDEGPKRPALIYCNQRQ